MRALTNLAIALIFVSCVEPKTNIAKTDLESGTDALLQAISIVDRQNVWVSGHQATFCRTINGGDSWQVFSHPIDSLQFRDIHAFDKDHIVLMSAGLGIMSRIFLFDAQNRQWQETYLMPHPEGFLNTIEFWDDQKGIAFGDSFNGQLFALKTIDGGQSWSRIAPEIMPAAGKGEGGFAASGTCISLQKDGKVWIGTGAGGNSRILYSPDYGETWIFYANPIIKGESAGVTSIRMATEKVGWVVGGDLGKPDDYTDNVAFTLDSGKVWTLTGFPITKGPFYGSDLIPVDDRFLAMACGPNGIDYTVDYGHKWHNLDTMNYWAVDLDPAGFGYAVGTKGKILKLAIDRLDQ